MFVEIKMEKRDENWHPECYRIKKVCDQSSPPISVADNEFDAVVENESRSPETGRSRRHNRTSSRGGGAAGVK